MNLIVITIAGIAISVLMRDSMPDSTVIWLMLFAVGFGYVTLTEIRAYLHRHNELAERHRREQESMADLMKERLLVKKSKAATPADEAKLVEQMANELKSRMGNAQSLSAANLKQMTKDIKNQLSHNPGT
jgi:hypothetical protein